MCMTSKPKAISKTTVCKTKFVDLLSKSYFSSKEVKVKGYLLQQVFHINDSGLVWEEVP